MLSLHLLSRRVHHCTSSLRSFSSTMNDMSTFLNLISNYEKDNKLIEISKALDCEENKENIIKNAFDNCAEIAESMVSQNQNLNVKLWRLYKPKLPNCTYNTLINASVESRNIDQLTSLLTATKSDSRVASLIGVSGLFHYYKPFLKPHEGESVETPALASEIESRIVGHFSHWTPHMNKVATVAQSQMLFNNVNNLYHDDWNRMVDFIYRMTISSATNNALSIYEYMASFDATRASSFSLAAYGFLAAHDISYATKYLESAKERGHFSSINIDQYADLVRRSVPLAWPSLDNDDTKVKLKRHSFGKRHTSSQTVEIDKALSTYINVSSSTKSEENAVDTIETNINNVNLDDIKTGLDNLFYLARGSSSADKTLRYTFYKNLLSCNRPRTLLSYENRRRVDEKLYYSSGKLESPLPLDINGYICVLKAFARELDVEGILRTLADWNQSARFIATANFTADSTCFETADSSVYKMVIDLLESHPRLVTADRLERLFEQMLLDNVTPDDSKDIIRLFRFAKIAQSSSVINSLLDWVNSMMTDDNDSDSAVNSDRADSVLYDTNADIMQKLSVPKRNFDLNELVEIYDCALETNSHQKFNGDKSLEILFAMKKRNVALNRDRISLVMKALKNSKNFEAVLELFRSMSSLGVDRDVFHVSFAAIAYIRTDQMATGLGLLERFEAAHQPLKDFVYYAAAFEMYTRLCNEPYLPFSVGAKDSSGNLIYVQKKEATKLCMDMFLRAMKISDMYSASRRHIAVGIRFLDEDIYEDMLDYLKEISEKNEDDGLTNRAITLTQLLMKFKKRAQ